MQSNWQQSYELRKAFVKMLRQELTLLEKWIIVEASPTPGGCALILPGYVVHFKSQNSLAVISVEEGNEAKLLWRYAATFTELGIDPSKLPDFGGTVLKVQRAAVDINNLPANAAQQDLAKEAIEKVLLAS